jgi:hypothetical protein
MNLGALDATVHGSLAQEYGVRGYPTIKYFAPGSSGNLASGLLIFERHILEEKWVYYRYLGCLFKVADLVKFF